MVFFELSKRQFRVLRQSRESAALSARHLRYPAVEGTMAAFSPRCVVHGQPAGSLDFSQNPFPSNL